MKTITVAKDCLFIKVFDYQAGEAVIINVLSIDSIVKFGEDTVYSGHKDVKSMIRQGKRRYLVEESLDEIAAILENSKQGSFLEQILEGEKSG